MNNFNIKNEDKVYSLSTVASLAVEASNSLPCYIVNSPILEYPYKDNNGNEHIIHVKDETVQLGNSFKDRGAAFAIGKYVLQGYSSVIAASAGNHGLGVARAANYYDLRCTVVLPKNAEEIKKDKIRDLGSRIIEVDGDFNDAENLAISLSSESDSKLIHPFADKYVAAGQGTIAVELLRQVPDMTHTYIPVGGGGLLLGVGSVIKLSNQETKIIAAQPTKANTFIYSMARSSLTTGKKTDSEFGGLAVRDLDHRTFLLGSMITDRCVELSTEEVYRAVKLWKEFSGKIIEPAAAVGFAACLKSVEMIEDKQTITTIITGSNYSQQVEDKINLLSKT